MTAFFAALAAGVVGFLVGHDRARKQGYDAGVRDVLMSRSEKFTALQAIVQNHSGPSSRH